MLLRYLAARLFHRGPHVKRYLQMGLGIERRAHDLAQWWEPHQQRTRDAQQRWVKTAAGGTLTVLGAGRLHDFDAAALLPQFERLRFVDADPLCLASWKALQKPVEPVFTDITNCLDPWIAGLPKLPTQASWTEALQYIEGHSEALAAYSAPTDALLSLNLLSQLPVGWQEGVKSFLSQRYGAAFVDQHEEEWLDAVTPGNRMLIQQHLAAIEASGARHVLLITDVEFIQYFHRNYSRVHWEPDPIRYSAQEPHWEADPGVSCEVSPALEDVALEACLPSYQLEWTDTWLWHISPMAVECTDCGTLHRVAALAFRRR